MFKEKLEPPAGKPNDKNINFTYFTKIKHTAVLKTLCRKCTKYIHISLQNNTKNIHIKNRNILYHY